MKNRQDRWITRLTAVIAILSGEAIAQSPDATAEAPGQGLAVQSEHPLHVADDPALARDSVINPDSQTYDSHPSAATGVDGTMWLAWHAYRNSRDQVLLRQIAPDGMLGPVHTASEKGAVHGPPTVVVLDGDSVWVIWSAETAGRWQVQARNLRDGVWQSPVTVSEQGTDAIHPTAVRISNGQMMVAWSGLCNGRFRLCSRVLDGNTWRDTVLLSSESGDAFRPVLAVDDKHSVWTFWDGYKAGRYGVMGRCTWPELGRIENVSPNNQHCLMPTALATRQGLCVAWLQKKDVMGGPGVVSQWHTLHAAVRDGNGWTPIADEENSTVAAELTQGLVAKIDPKPVATGGYLGRRTAPLLLEDDDSLWLLWERKISQRGSTPNVVGELVGRPMQHRRWGTPVVLHSGQVDYHLSRPHQTRNSRFVVLASQLPHRTRRRYHRLVVDIAEADTFVQDKWAGWQPVDLPIPDELTERREICVDGTTYKLYWADMHCHSGLTGDAEGEQDELTYYARDRARLDVVVFTNNDFLYDVPLTEYEYALGNFFGRVYTQPGRFLSLPGYEWTSRVPGVPAAKDSDPANWTPPYKKNRSYPNHRSVIYPPSGGPVIRHPEVANDIAVLNRAVERAGGVTLTQHAAFRLSGHPVEVGLELTTGWGNYIARAPEQFHKPLNQGARLAFVANGDSHRRAPGLSGALTGIYARELTIESILDALRNRRCYATNGSRIFVDARVDGTMMGQDVAAVAGSVTFRLRVVGTRPIVSAVLVRDGREIRTFTGNGKKTFSLDFQDSGLPTGVHWYYWRISQERNAPGLPGNLMAAYGHLAWSTPHWVVVR